MTVGADNVVELNGKGDNTPVLMETNEPKKEFLSDEHQEMLRKMMAETAPAMAVRNFVINFVYTANNMGPNDQIDERTGEIIRGPLLPGLMPQS